MMYYPQYPDIKSSAKSGGRQVQSQSRYPNSFVEKGNLTPTERGRY